MIPISSATSGGLAWSKIPRQRGFALTLNGEAVAWLHKSSFWSSNAMAESQDGKWLFRSGNFWGTTTHIVETGSANPIASFKQTWHGGGTLEFSDGQRFAMRPRGFWGSMWQLTDEREAVVLQVHSRRKQVELVSAAGLAKDRLMLLVLFTLHRMQQAEADAASTASIAVVCCS